MSPRLVLLAAVAASFIVSAGAAAQDTIRVRTDTLRARLDTTLGDSTRLSARRVVRCDGQRVDDIVVHTSAPTVALLRRVPVVAELVRSVHVTTRPEIVRRFLLFGPGEACSERRRAESERILRAQPFLADAQIQIFENDHGGVDVEVRTIDEASAVIGGALTSQSPFLHSVRLGSSNLGGNGVYLSGNWREARNYRDGYGVRFADYQVAGKPYIVGFEAQRNPIGDRWQMDATHPFLTDFQRVAWHGRAGSLDEVVRFIPRPGEEHGVRLQRRFFDVGGIVRIGPPGRLSLFGASVSGENDHPASASVLVTPTGLAPDTTSLFVNRYASHRIARLNALWGVRDIEFVQVHGFDALTGVQDIPVGFQLGTLFGRTLRTLGSRDDDIFMSADLYIGAATPRLASRLQLQGEGRRANDLDLWDGVLASGRAAQYVKVSDEQTTIATLEFSGGWRMRSPFAVTLGEQPGGVRGFAGASTPGSRRAIARLENRVFLGRPYGLADFGIGVFGDAGRLWAGDVPYGTSTAVRSSIGVSLLGALPPRSARLWRLDIAYPLNPEPGRHRSLELRIVSSDQSRFFWQEPNDVAGARERTVPSSIFNWP